MISTKSVNTDSAIRPFRFESYGVRVEISSNDQDFIDAAAEVCRKSLLNNVHEVENGPFDVHFEFPCTKSGRIRMIRNQEQITHGRSRRKFLLFFDSIIRVSIAEYADGWVFLHAGVVGWKGKAIVLPADSFKGKSTLVAELVRHGAEYYSDDFAVFDKDGHVYPFPRLLSMRTDDGKYQPYQLTVDELGGISGKGPLPVGTILFTEYVPKKRWTPTVLTSGQGVLELVQYTFPIRYQPDFSFRVLNKIASRATILTGSRGPAEKFARTLLNFVDKTVD